MCQADCVISLCPGLALLGDVSSGWEWEFICVFQLILSCRCSLALVLSLVRGFFRLLPVAEHFSSVM